MNSYPQKTVVARPKNVTQGGCKFSRLLGIMLLLLCAVGLSLNAAAQFAANNDGKDVAITAESCLPANGFIDPGETNTLSFVIKNTSGADRANVKVNILSQGGVTFPSGEVSVGGVAKDATFTVSFSFRADGSCRGSLTPTLRVTSDGVGAADITYVSFQLGATVKANYEGSAPTAIAVNDFNTTSLGRATPYGSPITISGMPKADTLETVENVVVTLHNVSHTWSQDLQVLLAGPNGKRVILMANAGGASDITAAINNLSLTFNEEAGGTLPPASQIVSGTYKSSNFGGGTFPDVGGATDGSLKAAFNGMADPNGTWRLYVIDDSALNSGAIAGGWSMTIRTTRIVCCGAGQLWPFVDRIPDYTIDEDGASDSNRATIADFNVKDLDDADSSKLTVTAVSGDQSKVTNDNIIVENAGGNRRLIKVKSLVANANGNAPINVVVTDPQGHTSTSSFLLKINAVNDKPSVSNILGQKVTQGTPTGPIAFTVSDVETLAENLLVLPTTSDPTVVPVENILIGGAGANRTVNVQPATPTTSGSATIELLVRAPGESAADGTTRTFVVNFGAQPGNPTITPLAAAAVNEDGSITIPFNIRSGVASVSADALTLTKASGNTGILPLNNIVFAGSGIDRTVTLTPAANQNGQVSVTLTVANGALTDSTSFTLTVNNVNDAPTITSVGPVTTNEDTTTGDIVFTVADIETAAAALNISLTSDNTALIPNIGVGDPANLTGAGGYSVVVNGAARSIRVRPVANQFGKATLTVTVTDTGDPVGSTGADPEARRPKAASSSFVLTVNAVNDAPTLATVDGQTWPADGNPTVSFPEDSDNTPGDDIGNRRTLPLGGITPGNPNESSQTTTLTASSSQPDIVSIEKIDPASVGGESANTTLWVRLGANRYGEAEITLTLTDNGGTDLGGVATTTKKFKINVTPVNDAPSMSFPTLLPPLAEGQPLRLNAPKNRSFTLGMNLSDVETPKTFVAMQASVANDPEGIFPIGSILFDPGRTLVTFIPNGTPSVLPYTVTVTVSATDRGPTNGDSDQATTTASFTVTILDIEPPTITSSATDVQIDEDTVASATLTILDNDEITQSTPTFSVRSDNPGVVPNDGILLGPLSIDTTTTPPSRRATRQLAIVPATDQFGVANITVSVKDQEDIESAVTIRVTVRPVSDRPTITLRGAIAPTLNAVNDPVWKTIGVLEDKATTDTSTDSDLLEFDVFDAVNETPADNLVITRSSSNTDLVPVNNIAFSTSGNRRTLVVTPAANKPTTGSTSSTITLTVTDESGLSSSAQFTLTVTAVNDAPTINQVSNMTINENAGEQTVNLSGIGIGPDSAQSIQSIVAGEKDKGADSHNVLEITQQPVAVDGNGNSSFKFRPRPFANGTGTITVTVTDDGGTANDGKNSTSMSFDVVVQGINHPPVISFQQPPAAVDTETDVTIPQGANSGVIPFYVSDTGETPVENLQVTALSSNPNLIPNTSANLQLGGGFGTRGLLIQPVAGQGGTAVVTLTVTDGGGATSTAKINVTVIPGVAPTIVLTPSSQHIQLNQFTDLIQINLFDAQTPADQLKIGYQDAGLLASDNPTLVPASPSNIQFGGSGANRVMIILPNQNQTGTANITVRVKDADGNIGSAVFTVQVLGSAPTITTPVPNQVATDINKTSPPVTVTVNDKETFAPLLTVTGKSSDQSIVADNNIFALGGATRSITVLAGSKGGSATITLTVTDAEGQTATTSFVVNVNDNNPNPTITSIPAQTTKVNTPTGLINFVVGDVGTPVADLTVTATSGNTTLVPNANISLPQPAPSNPAARSLIITPANNQTGVAIITVTVRDGGGKEASTSFALTVNRLTVPNDFNGDGSQDIIFQDANGNLAAWFMSGDDLKSSSFLTPNNVGDTGWRVVGSGDFNADSKTDLLFQHTDGTLSAWLMDGVTRTGGVFLTPSNPGSPNWKAAATGDFNKDGKVDILYQHTDGTLAIWYMDGTTLSSVAMLKPSNAGRGWNVVGTGDINRDGNLDIIFQYTDTTMAVWYMVGSNNLLLAGLITPQWAGTNWRAVGTIDLNGDGMTDFLFQHQANANVAIWYMNKEKLVLGKSLNPPNAGGTWQLVAP